MTIISIIFHYDVPLSHISLHAAERGKLKIVLFDEAVECLLAVCRDCLQNNLSETPPLSKMLNKQRQG